MKSPTTVRYRWLLGGLVLTFLATGAALAARSGGLAPWQGAGKKAASFVEQAKPAEEAQKIDPEKTGPIRHYIMIEMLNGVDVLQLDRWYMTYHARETLRRTQRRQTKYATFRTYTPPSEEAKAMNMWQGRMTEIGFANLADFNKGWVNVKKSGRS
jgi:hypothetical protein